MNKRTIKKRLMRLDELALPAKEKMLPPEALVKKEAPIINERKNFPRLAVASLAIVALVVAIALVIGGITNFSFKSTNHGSSFDNSVVAGIGNSEESGGNTATDKDKEISHSDNSTVVDVGNSEESCENVSVDMDKDKDISIPDNSVEVDVGNGEKTPGNGSTDKGDISTDRGNESTDKSEEAPITLPPIITCGKYTGFTDGYVNYVPYGEVFIQTMQGISIDVEELKEDVLYAVCFKADPVGYADYYAQTEYGNEIRRLRDEQSAKRKEAKEKAIAFIAKYAKVENHYYVKEFEGWDYQEICEMIYNTPPEQWPGKEAPEYEDIVNDYRNVGREYDEKILEFERLARENATAKMYEYLESLGVEFYDKEVYVTYYPLSNDVVYQAEYRIAFLSKEQIESVKGGDDYGVLIEVVFDELAKQDNEPVYFQVWFIDG